MNRLRATRKPLLSLLVLLLAGASWHGALDRAGEAYLDRVLGQAVAAYAIARGINAVISVAKGSEVSVEPLGVGVTLAVGQVLDPVDDLVERFSWVMLLATVALGVQRLLLTLGGMQAVSLTLSFGAALVLLAWWRPQLMPEPWRAWVLRGFVMLVAVRYAMIALVLASDLAHGALIGAEVEQATVELGASERQLSILADEAEPEGMPVGEASEATTQELPQELPWWSRLDELWDEDEADGAAGSSFSPRARIAALQRSASDTVDDLMRLAAAFITQTVLLPLLFLWLLLRAAGYSLRQVGV